MTGGEPKRLFGLIAAMLIVFGLPTFSLVATVEPAAAGPDGYTYEAGQPAPPGAPRVYSGVSSGGYGGGGKYSNPCPSADAMQVADLFALPPEMTSAVSGWTIVDDLMKYYGGLPLGFDHDRDTVMGAMCYYDECGKGLTPCFTGWVLGSAPWFRMAFPPPDVVVYDELNGWWGSTSQSLPDPTVGSSPDISNPVEALRKPTYVGLPTYVWVEPPSDSVLNPPDKHVATSTGMATIHMRVGVMNVTMSTPSGGARMLDGCESLSTAEANSACHLLYDRVSPEGGYTNRVNVAWSGRGWYTDATGVDSPFTDLGRVDKETSFVTVVQEAQAVNTG